MTWPNDALSVAVLATFALAAGIVIFANVASFVCFITERVVNYFRRTKKEENMDPTATLIAVRSIANRINSAGPTRLDPAEAHHLAQLVLDLDEWIAKGGFLPEQWVKKSAPAEHES